jgi:hypothetical protein
LALEEKRVRFSKEEEKLGEYVSPFRRQEIIINLAGAGITKNVTAGGYEQNEIEIATRTTNKPQEAGYPREA